MTNTHLMSWVRSAAISVCVTVVILAIMIIVGEEVPTFKNWLKATFYHHWLGKGDISLMVFAASLIVFRLGGAKIKLSTFVYIESIVVLLSVFAISAFFLMHMLHMI